ncbi:MAG: gluconate 2-dehydrogenase subunit 3 family protein [Flavobacteriaceae bacterium]
MDRRIALKNMGLALGYTVATPTLISIVQSCQADKALEWTPDFFSKDEGAMITHLVDIILPKTDTPSATEVQVNLFIDRFIDQVMEKEQQDFVKMISGKFLERALKASGKEKGTELSAEDLEPLLASTLSISKEQAQGYEEAVGEFMEAMATGEAVELDDAAARYAFASNLRNMTIWGYKASEYVGEEVLAYLPVPGEYIACGDLNELSGGKAWSI